MGGDGINELNQIKYLSRFFDVYYNNQLIDLKRPNYNQFKTLIEPPNPGYDIYYVRNNPNIFKQVPQSKTKIYFASPFDEECFTNSDFIACPTESWRAMLKVPSRNWGILYPDYFATDNAIVLSQKLDPDLIYPMASTPNAFVSHGIPEKSFKICHFGSLRNSCFPSYFLRFYERIKSEIKEQISVIFLGASPSSLTIPNNSKNFHFIPNIEFREINSYINSSDMLLYNQRDYQSEYAGSNKIIEAIVCEKPILSCRSAARQDELGEAYPLFYDLSYKPPDDPHNSFDPNWIHEAEVDRCVGLIEQMVIDPSFYDSVVDYLKALEKERFYNTYQDDPYVERIISHTER